MKRSSAVSAEVLEYYRTPGAATDVSEHANRLAPLPREARAIFAIVDGLLTPVVPRGTSVEARARRRAAILLDRIVASSDAPLAQPRSAEARVSADARDFALLACALLRFQGMPARVRCGFSADLDQPGAWRSGWYCECWSPHTRQVARADGFLFARQHANRESRTPFDPLELPAQQVRLAGAAWARCRAGNDDARQYGRGRRHGLGYIRGHLLWDLAALNKVEFVGEDHPWGLKTADDLAPDELELLDRIATATQAPGANLNEIHALFGEESIVGPTRIDRDRGPAVVAVPDARQAPPRQLGPLALALTSSEEGHRRRMFAPRARGAVEVASDRIVVRGARQHNLKNIDVEIPRGKLVVLSGVSGSGKSSLAFDTIYAEAQRRYVESLSPFVRHMLEKLDKADVEEISGLSPAIAIEQKTVSRNPRSTVGTVTEIDHYIRLLYSRVGVPRCLHCGVPAVTCRPHEVVRRLATLPPGSRVQVLARTALGDPPPRGKRATQPLVFDAEVTADAGFERSALDGVRRAFARGGGTIVVRADEEEIFLGEGRTCPLCGTAATEMTSQYFSPNSPFGMCPGCRGLGVHLQTDVDRLIADPARSILDGALTWFGNLRKNKRSTWPLGPLDVIASHYRVDLDAPWQRLPERFRHVILFGSGDEKLKFPRPGGGEDVWKPVKGLAVEIERLHREATTSSMRDKYAVYLREQPCLECAGTRLRREARAVVLGGRAITQVGAMSIDEVLRWLNEIYAELDATSFAIAEKAIDEVRLRLQFLIDVGLHYLALSRTAPTLSGGEGQRIRLARQLGSGLTGVLYVLDEPSIGLHARDQAALLATLQRLRDLGNSVLVVEHDELTIRNADWLIDLGPGAGVEGGEVLAAGTPAQLAADPRSITGNYLSGARKVVAAPVTHPPRSTKWLSLRGARLHNLKSVTARFPIGALTCVTGVSGSGKSSLISGTLEPALERATGGAAEVHGPFDELTGLEHIDDVVNVSQRPIGRTPRSNPATYVEVYDRIREVYAATPEATRRGWTASRFSFNTEGGRCEACKGYGQTLVEMHFLPDVWVLCSECRGARFNDETLEVRYQGKTIAEVLDLDVRTALGFFAGSPTIVSVLEVLRDVGLHYLKLGQSATTLSGGEAQRIKLARELSQPSSGRTVYILDEPTTGLHFSDVQQLLDVLQRLVSLGNTVIVIEHNLDVISAAAWVVDLGPEGGAAGGHVVAEGAPETIADGEGHTARFLRERFGCAR